MTVSNVVLIAASEAESIAKECAHLPLDRRAVAVMAQMRHHWLATGDEDQFLAACEGLYRQADEDEKPRIKDDLEALQKVSALINAMQAGIPVDVEAMADEQEPRENPLGLRKLWEESATAATR